MKKNRTENNCGGYDLLRKAIHGVCVEKVTTNSMLCNDAKQSKNQENHGNTGKHQLNRR